VILNSKRKKIIFTLSLIVIILVSFFESNPAPDYKFQIITFSIEGDKNSSRIGYPITFNCEFMGSPSEVIIIWGDGRIDTITNRLNMENTKSTGTVNHTYTLQGIYSPKLQVWDLIGKEYSKSLDLTIQNNPIDFSINISHKNQIFEDQEVIISIENLFKTNEFLQKSIENLTFLYDFSDSQLTSKETNVSHTWENEGIYPIIAVVIDSLGTISRKEISVEVINKAPKAYFDILTMGEYYTYSKIDFSAEYSNDTISDENSLRYLWYWGDNTASWGKFISHAYSTSGEFNITLCVIDDNHCTDYYSQMISIHKATGTGNSNNPPNTENNIPFINIGTFPETVYEDEQVQFTAEIELQEGNITDYSFLWCFGDGTYSLKKAPIHAWTKDGIYNIMLNVTDVNGNEYLRYESIEIREKAPEILGPYSFQGIEGQAIVLDVEVYDAIYDEPGLEFQWFDKKNQLISTRKKPSLVLDNGKYKYRLDVTDPSGLTTSCDINIIINPISPEIFVSDYMYYGPPGGGFGSDSTGEIVLRAYSYDCSYDISELRFGWSIKNGKREYNLFGIYYDNYCEVKFKCRETTVYQGEVQVFDSSGNTRIETFEIYSTVEASDDKSIQQLEKALNIKLSAPQDSIDSDMDNLSDLYEIEVSKTNPFDKDTDDDGLWDGYDDSGIGEQTLGTSPTDSDSDDDGLLDGTEYWGWYININYFENFSRIHVNSDPLMRNTDSDSLSDYEEYLAKSHPRLRDSDGDQLDDFIDPYPTTWDFDEDLLSDYMEKILGTNVNKSDTDGDGIKDGEEVNGFGLLSFQTDPTCPDTDHDFLEDNAEIMNYNVNLEDEYGRDVRVNLSNPVSLHFPKFFTKAAVAQIKFAFSFGEHGNDETQAYGIEEEDVINLNVTITKASDNIMLYNSTTNSTRYFSQVVDISEIMNDEKLALNYYGDYVIEVRDVNGDLIPVCLLEQFELDFSRYLNPNCEDFDKDGIMDGIETNLLVRGTDIIDIQDFYNCSSDGKQYVYEDEELNKYFLEIPYSGRVYDAKLVLKINSGESLKGNGNITIEITKKSSNLNIEESVLMNYFEEFYVNDDFLYETTLDISNFIDNGKIPEFYGKYLLKIDIQDTNPNDTFYVSKYFIETDTFIQAGPYDTKAYITDASLNDTDNDGWSDSYEIFTSGTNPLSKDTDGDNAWDPNDRDPLRNIMLEIRPISGTFKNQYWPWPTPTLQIIVKFHINDLIDPDFSEETSKIGFCTAPQKATTNPTWWGADRTAWWNTGEGHHYYFDISDDKTIQSNTIPFYFQLWQMLSTGDVDIFAGSWRIDTYSINDVGHQEELTVSKNGDSIRCEVETIAIERANTIAIYNPNATVFNGHYQEQERMNIIQLYISEDGHYPASISFEHDEIGEVPNDWKDLSEFGQSPTVIDELDGHSKVLQFHDTNLIFPGKITYSWNESYSTGFLEVWLRMSTTTGEGYFQIRDGSDSHSIRFRFDNSGYMQYKVGDTYYNVKEYSANQWYHLRFKWDCSNDWHLWVDGISQDKGAGYAFKGAPTAMDGISIQTCDSLSNYYYYVDAIGGIFDEYYELGDNLVRSNCEGTPFVPGPNIIVIPTSLFSKTLLNSYFQNEQLSKTPLYTEKDGLFEFYSIDRDGNVVDNQCGDTDFMFIRYDIMPQDAMKILDSLLTCAVNQSIDENGNTITKIARIFDYVSTKFNGTNAVSMNLPKGLLSFIPWVSDFINSQFGDVPKSLNFLGLLIVGLLSFMFPMVGIVMSLFLTVALFSALFAKIAAKIGMILLTFLAKLLWVVIRAVLIIFFFIILAIEIVTTVPLILAMGTGLAIFSWFLDMNVNFGVNFIPPYGKDTRVGHVDIEIKGSNFLLEAWVKWIYWDFFDLFIPYIDMNLEMDQNSPLMYPPEDPANGIGTFLTCGYDQISSYKFNFHTIYWDTPYNAPPEYVILTLLSPSGNNYNYSMEISPTGYKSIEYWVGKEDTRTGEIYTYNETELAFAPPNWYRGVTFNITVDFENDFSTVERNGQWYYQFHTIADRENANEVVWPSDEYAIGPHFNETDSIPEVDIKYLQFSELAPYSGHANQEFKFSVRWADYEYNTLPISVHLVLELPNGSINTYEMNANSSSQYDYSMVSDYGNVTFTNYICVLNLSQYISEETVLFRHYYEAIHFNGNIETLFDTKFVDELGRIIESGNQSDYLNATEIDAWFEGPLVFPYSNGEPIIKKWQVQDLTNNKYLKNFEYSDPIWEEQELVFWLYIYDPDRVDYYYAKPRCFAEGSPSVKLINYGDHANTLALNDFTWGGYDYELQADKYWLQIGADEIGAGLWNFEFSINDTQGNTNKIPKEKLPRIRIVGSVDEIFNTLISSMTNFGYFPTMIFLGCAGIAQSKGFQGGIAATVTAIVTAVSFSILILNEINSLLKNANTGGLYGLGWALITIAICLNYGLTISGGGIYRIGYVLEQLITGIGFMAFTEFYLIGDLLFYLGDIFGFMALTMALGIIVNGVAGPSSGIGKSFDASTMIKTIIEFFCLTITLIGLFSFVFAGIKNGACYVLE